MANKDFFLDPDDAQTLGDISYMRKSVKVRHTFPKNLKNPQGFEITKDISSMSALDNSFTSRVQENVQESSFSNTTSQFTNSSNSQKSTVSSNNMDMFRNMARKIRKR
ncbi:MAG TPA: hypothetical protein ACFCUY_05305 [Xenococcaceae cyanobacterium]